MLVNRVWLHHFGEGFVSTPDDLGVMSETPSHPELCNWLASKFMAEGWSLKKLHKLIMTSAAYQQSSESNAANAKLDPFNHLLWKLAGAFVHAKDAGGVPANSAASGAPVVEDEGTRKAKIEEFLQRDPKTLDPQQLARQEALRKRMAHEMMKPKQNGKLEELVSDPNAER